MRTIRTLSLSISILTLSACALTGTDSTWFAPSNTNAPSNLLYPDSYEATSAPKSYTETPASSSKVVVPESYHVGITGPESSKNIDKNWVSSQNPQAYTIEIAHDEKASRVAGTLVKVPKNERTAEIKAHNGQYKGLYGTYPTYEAAQEKLNSLPDEVKQQAGVKAWGDVQRDVQ